VKSVAFAARLDHGRVIYKASDQREYPPPFEKWSKKEKAQSDSRPAAGALTA
jgi:hypothetical protein